MLRFLTRIVATGTMGLALAGAVSVQAEEAVSPPDGTVAPVQEGPSSRDETPTPAGPPLVPVPKILNEAVNGEVKALRRGPLLIHGNYCGVGNRPGKEPIDPLDAACMHHDACTQTGKLPSCACDNRLREEATAIAHDPQAPLDIKALAAAMAASMVVLICK